MPSSLTFPEGAPPEIFPEEESEKLDPGPFSVEFPFTHDKASPAFSPPAPPPPPFPSRPRSALATPIPPVATRASDPSAAPLPDAEELPTPPPPLPVTTDAPGTWGDLHVIA